MAKKLNQRLVKQMNLSEDEVKFILQLHEDKDKLVKVMEETNSKYFKDLRTLAEGVTQIEYRLQDAWGFKRDINYHRYWYLPHCKCPVMDNNDWWGTDRRIVNDDCPIHGGFIKEDN